jgi:hypothetical protein
MSAASTADENAYVAPLTSSDDLSYQILSRSAVASVLLALFGLLSFPFLGLLVLPLVGLGLGIYSLRVIRKYPAELVGKPIAITGTVACAAIFVISPLYHAYVYATEVPPGYQRVHFSELMSPTGAADQPTDKALALDGQQVFLKGYIHPTSMDSPRAKRFVLVPDLGTCCFGGQPPLTHMIEVTLTGDEYATKSLRKQKLAGTLRVNRVLKPIEGLTGIYYQLKADQLR